ncbi:hypothetical protein M3N55_15545 [Roseibaca sp. V10]|uniref:Sigma-70 family RNA polymerase sigma factor n=1 Tax=Roseinatronobacter domitianus TaxID=2940293 RepID=A0ABT0M5L7_9RHOB|nr:hypothetical protein [Roseibaca domitiana]MCL1630138.1 hypothetical protein [Roseibaca domitiana]
MSSNWSALHAQLVRSVNRHSARIHINSLLQSDDKGLAFRDPTHLLGWLHARESDPAEKNDILARLLRAATGHGSSGIAATELLLLALWPGLCVVRYRLRALCQGDDLDAGLLGNLSIGIRSAKAERINSVAATLLRNLERDLKRIYIGDDNWARSAVDVDLLANKIVAQNPKPPETILSAVQGALGEDGLLVGAVHIGGFTQKEAAEHLGISHDAARKRCQRIIKRLQDSFDEDCPNPAFSPAFPR